MNDNFNIEGLFKEKFENYSQVPQKDVWNKINRKISINNFLKFNASSLNVFYVGGVVIAIILSSILFLESNKTNVFTPTNKKTIHISSLKSKSVVKSIVKYENKTENNINNIKTNVSVNNKAIDNRAIKEKTNTIESVNSDIKDSDDKNIANSSYKEFVEHEEWFKLDFLPDYYEGCAPLEVNFNNLSENCTDYEWDFDNGIKSTKQNPRITFDKAGIYIVKLKVKTPLGEQVCNRAVKVYQKPEASLTIQNKGNLFEGDEIHFTNTSLSAEKYIWNFGEGNTSDETNPVYKFKNKGIYSISLKAISEGNCVDNSNEYKIVIKDPKYKVVAPNAFTPDMDGPKDGYVNNFENNNDIFIPKFQYSVAEFKLRIYNRRGVLVFESNNSKLGWNGYYRNTLSPMGVYIWECSGKFADGESFYNSGDLSLIYTN